MDLRNKLEQVAKNISEHKDSIHTEEATKIAFIIPFIHALGYATSSPKEVIPENVADVGTKRGEKVDYAIMRNLYQYLVINL